EEERCDEKDSSAARKQSYKHDRWNPRRHQKPRMVPCQTERNRATYPNLCRRKDRERSETATGRVQTALRRNNRNLNQTHNPSVSPEELICVMMSNCFLDFSEWGLTSGSCVGRVSHFKAQNA